MKIEVLSRSEAERKDWSSGMWAISITDPWVATAELLGCGRVHRVQFKDVTEGEYLMAQGHSDSIWRFVNEAIDAGVPFMVIHCEAGISRSAAVAKSIVEMRAGMEWVNKDAMLYVAGLGHVSRFRPNQHVYRLMTSDLYSNQWPKAYPSYDGSRIEVQMWPSHGRSLLTREEAQILADKLSIALSANDSTK
jgi:predicted protein tyrosine phosphatase